MAAFKGKIVLFGGHMYSDIGTGYVDLGDTWEFDGKKWTERKVTNGPKKRYAAAMAVRGDKLVLHGGVEQTGGDGGYNYLTDTWEWDGNTWTEKLAPSGPGRLGPSMATLGGNVVLFGGDPFGETWLWNGAAWTEWAVTGDRPPGRYNAAMATYGNKVVLFGGFEGELILGAPRRSDTWEWDGATWKERKISGPAPRSHHAMAAVPR
jgi:N-acetylneuraminic acid mutarotase